MIPQRQGGQDDVFEIGEYRVQRFAAFRSRRGQGIDHVSWLCRRKNGQIANMFKIVRDPVDMLKGCLAELFVRLLRHIKLKSHDDAAAAAPAFRRRRPLSRYTAARSSSSGSADGSIPSTRGIGSKIIFLDSLPSSATSPVNERWPRLTCGRSSGQ